MSEELRPLVADVPRQLCDYRDAGRNLLFEGAQGTQLDLDHGTYPYVTSSTTTAGGVATGAGIAPGSLDFVLGVTKAYTTRVGEGPFPTELEDDTGRHMARRGREYGSTTGRPRRCGWLDLVALRQAVQVNGIDALCLTKLDVLDELATLRLCVAYRDPDPLAPPQPHYEELPGWLSPTAGVVRMEQLPAPARKYISRIEEFSGVPVEIVSTGPERHQSICNHSPWEELREAAS